MQGLFILYDTQLSLICPSFDVPDRISSLGSLNELNPHRKWNLILVSCRFVSAQHFALKVCLYAGKCDIR